MTKKQEKIWIDARGKKVPFSYVPKVDRKRNRLVAKYHKQALKLNAALKKMKQDLIIESEAFVDELKDKYGILRGGQKGNLTLTSFDGSMRIIIAQHDSIAFNEQLQLAQELIAQWLMSKIDGIDSDLHKLIDDAFYAVNGNIRTGRIMSLLRLDIKDAKWQEAMQLIKNSFTVSSTKEYIRFYAKNDASEFEYIPLDLSNA